MFRKREVVVYHEDLWFPWSATVYYRLLGTFPFVVTKSNSKSVIKWSPYWAGYSIFLALLITATNLWSLFSNILTTSASSRNLTLSGMITAFLSIALPNIILIYGVIVTPLKVSKFLRYVEIITEVDPIIDVTRKRQWKQMPLLKGIAILTLTSSTLFLDMQVYIRGLPKFDIWSLIFIYVPLYVTSIWTVLISYTANQTLATFIERLQKFNKYLAKNSEANQIIKVFPKGLIMPKLYINKKQPRLRELTTDELHQLYLKLYDASKVINDFLKEVMTTTIIIGFTLLITTLYWLFMELEGSRLLVYFISSVLGFIAGLYRVAFIIEPSHECIVQMNLTAKYVTRMMTRGNVLRCEKKKMKRFGLTLELCKIQISAWGFFEIRRQLFATAFGSITSYLVLLIQLYAKNQ